MSSERKVVRCLVEGRVQGVFFRASTAQRAADLGVAGWVRNLPDGRVEVVAQGDAGAVEELVEWLWQGPRGARVSGVTIETWSDDPGCDFRVR